MKIAILKQKLDVFGPWETFEYHTTNPINILNSYHSKTNSFETFLLFKADHIVVDTHLSTKHLQQTLQNTGARGDIQKIIPRFIKGLTPIDKIDFGKYDVIWTRDPILTGHIKELQIQYPKTLFVYELIEHWCNTLHTQAQGYDVFLDHNNYSMNSNGNQISFPYPRCPVELRKTFVPVGLYGQNVSLYIDWRDKEQIGIYNAHLPPHIKAYATSFTSSNPKSNGLFLRLNDNPEEQHEYFKRLANCKYFVSIAGRLGQSLVDAASLNCICIGTRKSGNHRLICHPSCFVNSPIECCNKIKEIESDINLQKEILEYQDKQIKELFVEYPLRTLKQKLDEKLNGKLIPIKTIIRSSTARTGHKRERVKAKQIPPPQNNRVRVENRRKKKEAAAARQKSQQARIAAQPLKKRRAIAHTIPKAHPTPILQNVAQEDIQQIHVAVIPTPSPTPSQPQPPLIQIQQPNLLPIPIPIPPPTVTVIKAVVPTPTPKPIPIHKPNAQILQRGINRPLVPMVHMRQGRPPVVKANRRFKIAGHKHTIQPKPNGGVNRGVNRNVVTLNSVQLSKENTIHKEEYITQPQPPQPPQQSQQSQCRINYIIACSPNKMKQIDTIKYGKLVNPQIILTTHLEQLAKLECNVSQITVISTVPVSLPKAYKFSEITKIIQSKNTSIYAQYFEAFNVYPNFDYYVIASDEYFPVVNNFGELLHSIYQTKFNGNTLGYVCSRYFGGKSPHAAHTPGIIHKDVFVKVLINYPTTITNLNDLKNFSDQVAFSRYMLDVSVKIHDFSNVYATPFFKSPDAVLNCSVAASKYNKCIFAPIQMIDNYNEIGVIEKLEIIKGK
jgi:hypothetical protein